MVYLTIWSILKFIIKKPNGKFKYFKKEANVLAEYLIGSEDEFNYKIQSSLTKK